MMFERYTHYALVAVTLTCLVTLVAGGMHYMRSSISSIEEIDNSQIPVLEDLAILIRLEQDVESNYRLAVLTGSQSAYDKYEHFNFTIQQRVDKFNEDLDSLDVNVEPLDRSSLGQVEKRFINRSRRLPAAGPSQLVATSMPEEVEQGWADFRSDLHKVTNAISEKRASFLTAKKEEFSLAFNFGVILTFVIVICTVIAGFTYQSVLRKKKEVELKALNTSRLASLGEMAGGIAHEINNPLAIIAGYNDLALSGLKKGREKDVQKAIYRLEKASNALVRITNVIQSLKVFSRDGSNDPKKPLEVSDLVSESISLCSEHISNMHIRVEVDVDDEILINGNKTELSQVLINLISNSIYAIKSQDYPWIRIEAKKQGEGVRLSVVDSGSGIEKEVVDQMTKPFYTTKPVGEGTGLGLSISFRIVRNHNGKLVYDHESQNTKFDILFENRVTVDESVLEEGQGAA